MFFGQTRRRRRRNTLRIEGWNVTWSTPGMSHLSTSIPRSRSIHGNDSLGQRHQQRRRMLAARPPRRSAQASLRPALFDPVHFRERPRELAVLVRELFRRQEMRRIGMPHASRLFSPGLAFISSKPERTMTFTSSPPSGVRCGSNPSRVAAAQHDDALPILSSVRTKRSTPIDADMDVG